MATNEDNDTPGDRITFELDHPVQMVTTAICAYTYINVDGEVRYGVVPMDESGGKAEMMGLASVAQQHIFRTMLSFGEDD